MEEGAGIFPDGEYDFNDLIQRNMKGIGSLIVPAGKSIKLRDSGTYQQSAFFAEYKLIGPKVIDLCHESFFTSVKSLKVEDSPNNIVKLVHAGTFGDWREFKVGNESSFSCGL